MDTRWGAWMTYKDANNTILVLLEHAHQDAKNSWGFDGDQASHFYIGFVKEILLNECNKNTIQYYIREIENQRDMDSSLFMNHP